MGAGSKIEMSAQLGKRFYFSTFCLDPIASELTRDGCVIPLTPTLFAALLYLVERPGQVVTRSELLDAIWPDRIVEDANVSQTIFMLRKALSGDGDAGSLIKTVPRRGYYLAVPVTVETAAARTADATPAGTPDTAPGPRGPLAGLLRGPPRAAYLAAGLTAFIILAVGACTLFPSWLTGARSHPQGIAVMARFANRSGDPVFDRTLGDILQIDLSQSPYFSVLSQRQVDATLDQMGRTPGTELTQQVSEEVCQRNNGNALVEGVLVKPGRAYIMTLTASECSTGRLIAAEKAETTDRDGVAAMLDRLLLRLREKVGESAASAQRYNVPLMPEKTRSLEALKAYSEANQQKYHGRHAEAVSLFRHAIELDPDFAAAYLNLATEYYNLDQIELAQSNLRKAYANRSNMNEALSLNASVLYNLMITGDTQEIIRLTTATLDLYPTNWSAWGNLANAQFTLGRFDAAAAAARHCVELGPDREAGYTVLARALVRAGRYKDAARVLAQAQARKLVGAQTAVVIAELAIASGDDAALRRAISDARGKDYEAELTVLAAREAYKHGEVRRGDALYARARDIYTAEKEEDASGFGRANDLATLGLPGEARAVLASLPLDRDHAYFSLVDSFLAFAMLGDAQQARTLMQRAQDQSPADTLLKFVFIPAATSILEENDHRPTDALNALAITAPFEMRDYTVAYQRGLVYLAAKNGAAAAAEFRKIVDRPGIDPAAVQLSLAQLGLARALHMQGDLAGSREAYRKLLDLWRDADADLPALQAARRESAAVGGPTPRSRGS